MTFILKIEYFGTTYNPKRGFEQPEFLPKGVLNEVFPQFDNDFLINFVTSELFTNFAKMQ